MIRSFRKPTAGRKPLAVPALLRRLQRNKRGGAAMIFAFSVLPLLAGAGMAVDGLYAFSVRSQLSSAVDAAALAGARALTSTTRDAQINQFFKVNFSGSTPVDPLKITPDLTKGTVSVTATAKPSTHIMKLFGKPTIPVSATSTAQVQGAGGMELSMVLDVTGSMKGSKLESLKRAGNNLLNALYKSNETVNKLSMAVVPFAGRVNIKPHREWMTSQPFLWQFWWAGCADERTGTNAWDDSPHTEEKFPEFQPGGSVLNAANYCPPTPVLPLTAEKSKIKAVIDGLQAEGNTRTDIGMSWGWRTLSPEWTGKWGTTGKPAAYNDPSIRKVVVMMTDGENTPSQSGDPINETQTYTQLLKVCDAMKAQGVIIYTIMFQAPARIEPNYSSCATTPQYHFVSVPTEAELEAAFGRIGNDLASQNVRLIR
jgi:Flp pilus assembly protein TadG